MAFLKSILCGGPAIPGCCGLAVTTKCDQNDQSPSFALLASHWQYFGAEVIRAPAERAAQEDRRKGLSRDQSRSTEMNGDRHRQTTHFFPDSTGSAS